MEEMTLTLPVLSHGIARTLAMQIQPGNSPAIIWLGGFRSDMASTKAAAIAEWGKAHGRKIVRFDYMGHGQSSGDFADGSLSIWTDDALAVIAAHGGHDPVLVGSSMGGWISLLVARRLGKGNPGFPSRMILIAPAIDFTEELMWAKMPDDVRETILTQGVWLRQSAYAPEPYPITRGLIEDGRNNLLFGSTMHIGCPLHILQGMNDPDVPPEHALRLVEHLPLDEVVLTTIKDGDHRLSRPEDIALLLRSLE
jgi:pimeloyl-ACP methyl ester carboxylesterase